MARPGSRNQGPRERVGTNSRRPASGARRDALEDFRGGVWLRAEDPGTARRPARSGRGAGPAAACSPAGRLRRARRGGRSAMNLERLRKRVRQYLDQVGVLAAALARAGEAGLQPPSAGAALRGPGAPRSQGRGPGDAELGPLCAGRWGALSAEGAGRGYSGRTVAGGL